MTILGCWGVLGVPPFKETPIYKAAILGEWFMLVFEGLYNTPTPRPSEKGEAPGQIVTDFTRDKSQTPPIPIIFSRQHRRFCEAHQYILHLNVTCWTWNSQKTRLENEFKLSKCKYQVETTDLRWFEASSTHIVICFWHEVCAKALWFDLGGPHFSKASG